MFTEVLINLLNPLLSLQFSEDQISELANNIADSLEINPKEGENIFTYRNFVLDYLTSNLVKQKIDNILNQQTLIASHISNILPGISDLDKLSTAELKTQLLSLPLDNQLSKDIFDINFGASQTLGEIIYQTKFNQGSKVFF